jgi:hypothetical protein
MTPPIPNVERILTTEQVKELIQPCTVDQIRNRMIHLYGDHYQHDYLTVHILYFGYLLARGDLLEIQNFMEEHKDNLVAILNTQQPEFYGGTVLHISQYWNSGQVGIDLFELLYNHGAVPIQDEYNQFPWEQNDETIIWVHPFGHSIGIRKHREFIYSYEYLKNMYEEL